MTADELMARLQQLTPEERTWPLIGHDPFDAYGDVVAIVPAALEHADRDQRRRCLYVLVDPLRELEWIEPDPSAIKKSLHDPSVPVKP